MQQLDFFPKPTREHGGAHSVGKRRGSRPLSTHEPLHLTLRSELATGPRQLTKHKDIIREVVEKAAKLFHVRVYRYAVCGNHLHFLVRGKKRRQLQNFFRVLAGHIAQKILVRVPIADSEKKTQKGCVKNQRKFWELLIYSRILTWGREYQTVMGYLLRNTLEALHLIAYKPRARSRGKKR